MDIEFKRLTYTVKTLGLRDRETRQILKGVNGRFHHGTLTAIMGPSGAGKSSLLNALSGYRSSGVTGRILVSGKEIDTRDFHKKSCYLSQDDLLQPLLTVGEMMNLSASLKLRKGSQRKQTCMAILKNLGLDEHLHTRTEKLSGGQKRRLSIALELVNNPPVFFLDEPTSGLDQVASVNCVKLLQGLAKEGRTVICTIHQPSASIFEQFDQVYVIAQGLCIYQGSPKAVVPFLSNIGSPCPFHYNPADFILELTEREENIEKLSRIIKNGEAFEDTIRDLEQEVERLPNNNNLVAVSDDKDDAAKISQISTTAWLKMRKYSADKEIRFETSSFSQFIILLGRMLVQTRRNMTAIYIQIFHHLLCAVLLGLCFLGSANDGNLMVNHLKFCVGISTFFAYTQIMVPVLIYPQELELVKKEYFNRWYGITPYYAALTVSKLPLQVFLNLVFCTLVYFMFGLPFEYLRFIIFCIVGNLTSLTAEGVGLAIGSAFNITNGCVVGPMMSALFLGIAIYGYDFAKNISWFMYITMRTSFIRCGLVAFVLTMYGFDRQQLDCNEIYCHFSKPDVILKFLDVEKQTVWLEMLSLLGLNFLFRFIAFINIKRSFP